MTGSVAKINPPSDMSAQYQYLNRPALSQYLESEISLWDPAMMGSVGTATPMGGLLGGMPTGGMGVGLGMGGYGMGYGMYGDVDAMIERSKKWTNGSFDISDNTNDRQTQSGLKFRGNQNVYNQTSENINRIITRLEQRVQENKLAEAAEIFDELCAALEKSIDPELTKNESRTSRDQLIRSYAFNIYEQIKGRSLVDDIKTHGDSAVDFGYKEAFGTVYHKNTAEETIAYMENTSLQNANKIKVDKRDGKVKAYATTIGSGAAAGAALGLVAGVPGVIVGAVVGGILGGFVPAASRAWNGSNDDKMVKVESYQ